MKKTVVIHQPDFLPYLGFFHRLLHADLYVVLDHVQFVSSTSRSWTNRDKIKTPKGEKWLTVSVCKCPRDTPINRVLLSDTVDWRANNLNLLYQHYREAPYFKEIHPHLERLYEAEFRYLSEFTKASIDLLCELLGIDIDMVLSSDLGCQGQKNELLVDILQRVGATTYLSGVGARAYFDPAPFERAGIEVIWQEFRHPVYSQPYGEFIPNLSSIDLLYNEGIDGARRILREAK
ncbi:WbqC family protein [Alcanivorax sp.]|uniref:WbqC family protein n=1 Tax=Alcanivorax sp. TaxID=1872427 RepID=UPI0025842D67|nr:WbqC family protein [Alcanivorax sp.]